MKERNAILPHKRTTTNHIYREPTAWHDYSVQLCTAGDTWNHHKRTQEAQDVQFVPQNGQSNCGSFVGACVQYRGTFCFRRK